MAEEDSEKPVASGQQDVAIPESATSEVPAPAVEPIAMPEAVVKPEESFNYAQDKTPSEAKEPPRVEETPPAPVEPEPVQAGTAHSAPNEPFRPEPEPFKPADAPSGSSVESTPKAAPAPMFQSIRDFREIARVKKEDIKRKKLGRIIEFLNTKAQNGSTSSPRVTNDEVEKLLHVSDATATRYLSALEKEGKIRQVGKTGTGVVYTKI